MKVILDTDIGENIDDLLALALALSSPEIELLAVTTVTGDTKARSRIVRRVTAAFGAPEIPVAAGYVQAMPHGTASVAAETAVTQGALAPDERGLPPPSPLSADQLIAELVAADPGEVTVVTIGAMTNLGQALVRFPETGLYLKGVVSCAGQFAHTPVSIGWNLRYDPIAATVVASSGVEWNVLSEGLMSAASLSADDIDNLRDVGRATTDVISQAIDLWQKNKPDATPTPRLDDVAAIAFLILPDFVPMRRGRLIVAVSPDRIAELWVEHDPSGPHYLSRGLGPEQAEELRAVFLERVLGQVKAS
ncbi:MAG: nucleoside hydrolase [Armatimonadetes bacterium]|nr:nucleoside hydrolase [Armatimonadota bacterium]